MALSEERLAEIEKLWSKHFRNGKHGGYHAPLSRVIVDLSDAHAELVSEVERLRVENARIAPLAEIGAAMLRLPRFDHWWELTVGSQFFVLVDDDCTVYQGPDFADVLLQAGVLRRGEGTPRAAWEEETS